MPPPREPDRSAARRGCFADVFLTPPGSGAAGRRDPARLRRMMGSGSVGLVICGGDGRRDAAADREVSHHRHPPRAHAATRSSRIWLVTAS